MAKRKLLYIPKINKNTFLFFFSKGETGHSYSFRDYSVKGSVSTTYARQYTYSDFEILDMAELCFDAETYPTNNLFHWHERIQELNRRFLPNLPQLTTPVSQPAPSTFVPPLNKFPEAKYPLFAVDQLFQHPTKSKKPQDMDRILTSPNSEDYVTWNIMQLFVSAETNDWWTGLIKLAKLIVPASNICLPEDEVPRLEAWRHYPSPVLYEQQSRTRMARSTEPYIVERSLNPKPVEGDSEIDLILDGDSYLVFIEAKLGSDISMSTSYDPVRNQIIRNIDILLDVCGECSPYFWMFAKDRGQGRAYVQLMNLYHNHPSILAKLLPHRDPSQIEQVAKNLVILLWKELIELVPLNTNNPVMEEVKRRVS